MGNRLIATGAVGFLLLGAVSAEARLTWSNSTRAQRVTGRQIAADTRFEARRLEISATDKLLRASQAKTKQEADDLRAQAALERQQAAELRRSADSVDSSSFKDVAIPLLAAGGIAGAAIGIAAGSGSGSTPASTYTPPAYTPPASSSVTTSAPIVMPYVPPASTAARSTSGAPSTTGTQERRDGLRADLRDSTVTAQVEVVPLGMLRRYDVAP